MRWTTIGILLLLVVSLSACAGGGSAVHEQSSLDFTLQVLDSTIQENPQAQYYLDETEQGGLRRISIFARDAQDLKALFVEIRFDTQKWHVSDSAPSAAFDAEALHLALPTADGPLQYGQVLPGYDQRAGFSGSGKLATLTFEPGAAPATTDAEKAVASAGPLVKLGWDPASNTLSWPYGVPGDYDQNGEVNIADLSPLGKYFGQSGPFGEQQLESQVDGDGNGEINLADLTPIGSNFGQTVSAYQVYFAQNESSLPQAGKEDNSGLVRGAPGFSTALGAAASERLHFDYSFGPAAPNGWVWVRPEFIGAVGNASEVLRLGSDDVENILPTAAISADILSGPAPLAVSFDASASSDPDGSIASYDWDWTGGDDGWSWENSTGPLAQHSFDADGSYTVALRVTDDKGAAAFAYQTINVQGVANLPPTGVLTVSEDSVLRKNRTITFELHQLADPEGYVKEIDWDKEGDGSYESNRQRGPASDPWADETFGYSEAGTYYPTARLTDSDGVSSTVSVTLFIEEDLPPHAALSALPLSGSAPLSIDFDASASTDDFPNGVDGIRTLRWTVDCQSDENLSHAATTHWDEDFGYWSDTLSAAGSYEVTLEVRDAAGQVDTASVHIAVGGTTMHTASFDDEPSSSVLDGALIGGRPAVIYAIVHKAVGEEWAYQDFRFARARDTLGEQWDPPTVLSENIGTFGGFCSLLELEGKAAASYYDSKKGQILFQRALNAEGTAWTEPVVLAEGVSAYGGGNSDLALINGQLAVLTNDSVRLNYRTALDPLGDSWSEPVPIWEGSFPGWPLSLADVAGNPTALFRTLELYYYVRATDPDGKVWPVPHLLYDNNSSGGSSIEFDLQMVKGRPACCFMGLYLRANDAVGAGWPAPVSMNPGKQGFTAITNIDGKLMVIEGTTDSYLIRCNDGVGDDWEKSAPLFNDTDFLDIINMGGFPGFFHACSFSTLY